MRKLFTAPTNGIALLGGVVLLLLSSCSPLSKSQVGLTRNYFSAVANYSDVVEDVNINVADAHFASMQLESLLAEDSVKFRSMISAIRLYEKELNIPDSIEDRLTFLNGYVQKYYALIPAGFNIYGIIKGVGSSVPGVGMFARALPNFKVNISGKKARKITRHINTNSEKVQASLVVLQVWANEKMNELVMVENQSLQDLQILELQLQKQTNTYDYYAKAQKVITSFYRQVFLTRKVVQNLSESITVLQNLEVEIRKSVQERHKDIAQPVQLNELVRKVQIIRQQNEKIQKIKDVR